MQWRVLKYICILFQLFLIGRLEIDGDSGMDHRGVGSGESFDDIAKFGILEVAGDDKFGRKVIIFNACKLPSNKILDANKLLRYCKLTLDRYVISDYILVYFHHGLRSHNKPPLSFLRDAYYDLGMTPIQTVLRSTKFVSQDTSFCIFGSFWQIGNIRRI